MRKKTPLLGERVSPLLKSVDGNFPLVKVLAKKKAYLSAQVILIPETLDILLVINSIEDKWIMKEPNDA